MTDIQNLPHHLRDDAPFLVCSVCCRREWCLDCEGERCGMAQPDGIQCGGVMKPGTGDEFKPVIPEWSTLEILRRAHDWITGEWDKAAEDVTKLRREEIAGQIRAYI